MIYELGFDDFAKVNHLFAGLKQYIPVMCITAGSYPGKVFVDDKVMPKNAIVWGAGGRAYVEGIPHNRPFNNSLEDLFTNSIIPQITHLGMDQLLLYIPATLAWAQTIETSLFEYKSKKREQVLFAFDSQRYQDRREKIKIPKGMRIEELDVPVVPSMYHDPQLVSEEFADKTTFAFALVKEDDFLVTCKCRGALHENEFMMELEIPEDNVIPDDFALMAVMALADYCVKQEYLPVWALEEDDTSNQNLAIELGFVEQGTYPVYTLHFNQ